MQKVHKEAKKKPKIDEDISMIERAKREKNLSRSAFSDNKGKQYTREVFKMWLMLPDQFKGAPERAIQLLGISDDIVIELLKIKTMQQFATEFGVHPPTLSRWRKEIESGEDGTDIRLFFRKLMREGLAALYRKLIEHGDAERFKVFASYVEGWVPMQGVQHSGSMGEGLSEEEKRALDNLLEKNTSIFDQ